MKTMLNLLRYDAATYRRTNKYVMPFLALLVAESGIYAIAPVRVADSYVFSMCLLFFIMVWMGLVYPETVNPVDEQLVMLKIGSAPKYYTAGLAFQFLLGACMSLFATLYPLLMHAVRGFTLYKTSLMASDVMLSFVLHCCVAFCGSSVGGLFHPRIMTDRKMALLLALFVSLTGAVKIGIHRAIPASVAVTWLFPPVSDLMAMFAGLDTFPVGNAMLAMLFVLAYALVLSAVKVTLLCKRKF